MAEPISPPHRAQGEADAPAMGLHHAREPGRRGHGAEHDHGDRQRGEAGVGRHRLPREAADHEDHGDLRAQHRLRRDQHRDVALGAGRPCRVVGGRRRRWSWGSSPRGWLYAAGAVPGNGLDQVQEGARDAPARQPGRRQGSALGVRGGEERRALGRERGGRNGTRARRSGALQGILEARAPRGSRDEAAGRRRKLSSGRSPAMAWRAPSASVRPSPSTM